MPYDLQPGEEITVPRATSPLLHFGPDDPTLTLNERPQWAFDAMESGEPISVTVREKTISGPVKDIRLIQGRWIIDLDGKALVYT